MKPEPTWQETIKELEHTVARLEERENNYLETIGQDTRTIKALRLEIGLLEYKLKRCEAGVR